MRIFIATAMLLASAALADVAKPVLVDVPPSPVGTIPTGAPRDDAPAQDMLIADVKLDELEAAPAPAYDRSRWLLLLPLLAALVVVWNVDWRERRVKAELAAAREARAPRRGGA